MKEFLDREQARALSYHLLAQCYGFPTEALKEEKIADHLLQLLPLIEESTEESIEKMKKYLEEVKDLQELQLDFSKLFIGPQNLLAPPYGSLYLENKGQIMGESTYDVVRLFNEAGVKKLKDVKEPQDHIRIELEFMYCLIDETIIACKEGSWEKAEKYIRLQLEFLNHHLGRWIKPFTDNVYNHAETVFYKNLALATVNYIKQDYLEDSLAMAKEFENIKGQK
ncbi:chaperone TorD involved in molybdoenzyme TorA maturation [Anaerovirgula multivorans]|uniref:Chaperone TorD involved in molybdoenzyme TorA maturation n=1 Tax=Anaerovirgula multivorans TaxID=312168 RepID=A0A239AU59_9FIRM|nr:molecular chaperone TorD family protein [Anaerovirgula multivorans]SNR99147.1 chaperone TorD involved in molybdoenzyme TorA maturation [Anaerovirgula multivorans]